MLGAALLGAPAQAQIVAPAGRTLFNHGVMVRTFVRFDNFSEGAPGLRVRRIVNPYMVVWGAHTNLSVTFVAPLVTVRSDSRDFPDRNFSTTSFGDGAMFVRHDTFVRNVRGGSTRLSPEFGVKVPSGGAFGSGSTDFIGGLVFSHVRDPHWWVADAEFTYTTTGDNGFRQGNGLQYDLAYLYRVWPRGGLGIPSLLLVLELNGEHRRRSRLDGFELAGTGGNVIFFSPGVELIASNRLVLEFSSPIPIGRNLRGAQPEPSSSFIAGVRWLF